MTLLVLGLMVVGLIAIYAVGPMRANLLNVTYGTNYSNDMFFWNQLRSVGMAILAFWVGFKLPYVWLRKHSQKIMFLGILLCVLLAFLAVAGSGLADCQLGGCRWYNLGPIGFQPAELMKFGLVLYLAQLVAVRRKEGKIETREFWLPFGIVSAVALFLVVILQKDLGTGVAFLAIILTSLLMSGVSMKKFWLILLVVILAGVGAIASSDHRKIRVADWLAGNSYHVRNAEMAIGTGGMFGVGVGNSVQAAGYLPESINDSVFAVIGEMFGFLGLLLVLGCFVMLMFRLLKISEHLPDQEERLVVVGIFAWILAHVVANVASMISLMPVTGITLPLLSYGGTSMMFVAGALGLAGQLSCYTSREVKNESISSGRGLRGTYYSGRRRSA